MWKRLNDIARNASVSNEEYEGVKPEIRHTNINILRFSSAVATLAMLAMTLFATRSDASAYPPALFAAFALYNAVIFFCDIPCFRNKADNPLSEKHPCPWLITAGHREKGF